jgi:sugar O-acyltransferase (sialic acid O-acetyltransferase NeuD family)
VEIRVPREDANDDSAVLVRWLADDQQAVEKGQPLVLLETSKTVFEVVAPQDGVLVILEQAGSEVAIGQSLGQVLGEGAQAPLASQEPARPAAGHLSKAAREFLGEQPPPANLRGIITRRDLQPTAPRVRADKAYKRILLLGAGSVGMQALDILIHDPRVRVVGLLDDHPQASQRDLFGYPHLGPLTQLAQLWADQAFDEAAITVGLNLKLRLRLYEQCQQLGIELANVIDPSARLNRYARMGKGNLICSFVHLGLDCQLGDNNFIAAHSSLDHHNRLGSHNLLGPGCLLSGNVKVGHRCTFGSGIVVQPNLSIGDDCLVASGAVILKDIPAAHAVRTRLQQVVEPISP